MSRKKRFNDRQKPVKDNSTKSESTQDATMVRISVVNRGQSFDCNTFG